MGILNKSGKRQTLKKSDLMFKKDSCLVRRRMSLGHKKDCNTETRAEPTFTFLRKTITKLFLVDRPRFSE